MPSPEIPPIDAWPGRRVARVTWTAAAIAALACWIVGFYMLPWWLAAVVWWWPTALAGGAMGFLALWVQTGTLSDPALTSRRPAAARANRDHICATDELPSA